MLRFELKKLWRRKQFLILGLIVITCVAIIFFRNFWLQEEIVEHGFQSLAPHSHSVYETSEKYRNEMVFRTEDGNLDEAFIAIHDNAQVMSREFNRLLDTITEQEWDHVPEVEMAFIQTVLNHIEYGESYDGYVGSELEQSIEKNKILLKHSLPYEHEFYSISTTNFIKVVFTFLLSVPGLTVLIFLLGDFMVTEKEHNTIRTLSTQPITKWRLTFGKFLGQLSAVIFTLVVIILACFVIPLLFGGQMGSFSYPQFVKLEDGFKFISLGHYLLLYIILFLGTASFIFSVVLLFSSLFKDRLIVLFSTLITLFGGVYLTNQFKALQSVIKPFFYCNFQTLMEEPGQLGHSVFIVIPYVIAFLLLIISVMLQKVKHAEKKGEIDLLPLAKGAIANRKNKISNTTKFEWRKLRREGQVKRFTIIILLLIVGAYVIITFSTQQLRDQYIFKVNGSISFANEMISILNQDIERNQQVIDKLEMKGSTLTAREEELKITSESAVLGDSEFVARQLDEIERRKNELNAYKQGNWKPVYESWIEEMTNNWNSPYYANDLPTERGGLSDFAFMAGIEEYVWMKENNLKPVHSDRLEIWTVHDKLISPIEQAKWNQDTRKMDNTGLFYVYTLFTTPAYLVLLGIFVFVLGVGMTAEKGVRRTLTFLKTQPVSISGIYLGKTWISMLITVSIAVGTLLMMLLIGTIGNRFGDWKFPVIHYDPPSLVDAENYGGFIAEEGGFHFMYMGKYLLETGGLFLVSLVFLITLSLFFSLFFRHSMSALFITMIVAVGGYAASTLTKLSAVAQWLPFTYLNIGKIANGELAIVLENEGVTIITGFIALLLGIILLIIVGWVYARSRLMKIE